MSYDPIKGQICFIDLGPTRPKERPLISFEMKPEQPFKLSKALMNEFTELGLTDSEKRELTLNHRKKLHQFRHLDMKKLKDYSSKFIKEINKHKEKDIKIKASHMGAYICLTAIFSGELPKDLEVTFEFSSVPLGLFPKQLIKDNSAAINFEIIFLMESDAWIKPFKTLYLAPSYMRIGEQSREVFSDYYAA